MNDARRRIETSAAARAAVGVFAVSATYVLFLLWDQFGFLRRLETLTDSNGIRLVMAAMGAAGLAASLATGALLGRRSEAATLRDGLALAALAVVASWWLEGLPGLAAAGALLGVATGVVTVSLAAGLRRWLPGPDFAVAVGTGTGLAYLVCNVPWLFEGTATRQAAVVAGLCLLAAVAVAVVPGERPDSAPRSPSAAGDGDARSGAIRGGFVTLVLAFLALVWLDSAAFAVIQETLPLKGATWATPAQQWLQGVSHLAAAIGAGVLLRRGHLRSLLLATYLLFGLAFQLLQTGGAGTLAAGPIYAIGISLYSTALVVVPTLATDADGRLPRRWRAAVLYGVAGWLGSALGVGMAQDLHRIPGLFVAAAGAVLVGGWMSTRPRARALLRTHALTLAGLLAAILFFAVIPDSSSDASTPPSASPGAGTKNEAPSLVEAGRRVYVAEGCMGCHSQYVRPRHARDLSLYGPHRPLDRSESPPLVGLRRLGPDLSNVGLRHDEDWLRHHLEDPRADNEASVMPSYAELFEPEGDGASRGDALVAYLHSLRPDESP